MKNIIATKTQRYEEKILRRLPLCLGVFVAINPSLSELGGEK
jgi:hypothetical protein